jgi:hypothetical protein
MYGVVVPLVLVTIGTTDYVIKLYTCVVVRGCDVMSKSQGRQLMGSILKKQRCDSNWTSGILKLGKDSRSNQNGLVM